MVILVGAACAQCGSASSSSAAGPVSPTVPVPPVIPAAPEVFVGAGDIAMCDAGAAITARLLDGIPGTVFALGDNAYPSGSMESYRDCYTPTWGRHLGRTFPTPGNHDYDQAGALPYFQYFSANAGPPGLGYYSFDLGAWHIISLNSSIPAQINSIQGQWLKFDLAAHQNVRCTLAFWHHPLFTSGQNGGTDMRDFWNLLYAAGAEIVLNGHDHDYERFALQDPTGRFDPVRGLKEFVVGTGGGTLRPFAGIQPNSEVRIADVYGVLKLTLMSDGYQWNFIPSSGPGDSGSGSCH